LNEKRDSVAIMTPLPVEFDFTNQCILISFFKGLQRQTYPKESIHCYFTCYPQLFNKYEAFLDENLQLQHTLLPCREVRLLRIPGFNREDFLEEMSIHRNTLLDRGKIHDWGFFVDSDVVIPTNAIEQFIMDNCDVVSGVGIIPSTFSGPVGYNFGNLDDQRLYHTCLTLEKYSQPRLYEIDGAATACLFLNHELMNDCRIRFRTCNGLPEDLSYCANAKYYSYHISLDVTVFFEHHRRFGDKIRIVKPRVPTEASVELEAGRV
jgi:hypothetical protein